MTREEAVEKAQKALKSSEEIYTHNCTNADELSRDCVQTAIAYLMLAQYLYPEGTMKFSMTLD